VGWCTGRASGMETRLGVQMVYTTSTHAYAATEKNDVIRNTSMAGRTQLYPLKARFESGSLYCSFKR